MLDEFLFEIFYELHTNAQFPPSSGHAFDKPIIFDNQKKNYNGERVRKGAAASCIRFSTYFDEFTQPNVVKLLGCFKSSVHFYESTLSCNISVRTYSI